MQKGHECSETLPAPNTTISKNQYKKFEHIKNSAHTPSKRLFQFTAFTSHFHPAQPVSSKLC